MPKSEGWLFPSPAAKSGHTTDIRKAFWRVVTAAKLDPRVVVRHPLQLSEDQIRRAQEILAFSESRRRAGMQKYEDGFAAPGNRKVDESK